MLCQVGPLKEQEVAKSWTISPGIGEGKGFKLMSSETFEDPCDSFPTLSFFFEEIYIYIYTLASHCGCFGGERSKVRHPYSGLGDG